MAIETETVTTKKCMVCQRTSQLVVPAEGLRAWREGELIQTALPGLTPDEREMLINGTHPDCFDSLFGDDEDDEERLRG